MEKVYVTRSTLSCAKSLCIPCFYKIFPDGYFPVLQQPQKEKNKRKWEETIETNQQQKLKPNQRPETCLRAKNPSYTGLYFQNQEILTVGDGDLSFSLSLAKEFNHHSSDSNLIATTYETYESLLRTYPDINSTLDELYRNHVTVLHGVDATQLELCQSLQGKKFDRIIWNFPCIRIEKGLDGQVSELDQNKELIRLFFQSVKSLLKDDTEIHLTHKTVEPFSWWKIEELAVENGFRCVLSVVFDRYNYPSYVNRKALDKKSFPCNDARVFVFVPVQRLISEDAAIISQYSHLLFPLYQSIDVLQAVAPQVFNLISEPNKKK